MTFDQVIFRYLPDAPEVLRRVSLDVVPGQVIGIVGHSGSGKSTLTKLIQRMHVPESGRVLIDGVDLALVEPAWLRRSIGVVMQENFLFNRSIRDNIALSDPAVSMERVVQAAKLAGAHEFIVELKEGYDSRVGERGSNLSGGQRQRIAIARICSPTPGYSSSMKPPAPWTTSPNASFNKTCAPSAKTAPCLLLPTGLAPCAAATRLSSWTGARSSKRAITSNSSHSKASTPNFTVIKATNRRCRFPSGETVARMP